QGDGDRLNRGALLAVALQFAQLEAGGRLQLERSDVGAVATRGVGDAGEVDRPQHPPLVGLEARVALVDGRARRGERLGLRRPSGYKARPPPCDAAELPETVELSIDMPPSRNLENTPPPPPPAAFVSALPAIVVFAIPTFIGWPVPPDPVVSRP